MNRIQQGGTARRIQSFDTKNAPHGTASASGSVGLKGRRLPNRDTPRETNVKFAYGLALQARHCKHYRKQKLFTIQQVAFQNPPFRT
jgi:hypothetical protein